MRKNLYKRRLIIIAAILLLYLLAFVGIYPVKIIDIQFAALLQNALLTTAIIPIGLLILLLIVTIHSGRIYCSLVCPLGLIQELSALVLRHKKQNSKTKNYPFKHFICALTFGAMFSGSVVLIRYIDPYSMFGSAVSFSVIGIIFLLCILVLVFFKNRFFCTNICPVGAFLGNCSKMAVHTMNIDEEKCISCKMCEKNCQAGCIDIDNKKIDNEMCLKCMKCYSVCPKGAIYFGKRKPQFSQSRRKALIGTSVALLFAAGYLSGIKFTKELAKKVKNIILPAGAKNANRMANKCLNCNLCIKNCPNGILVKADNTFNAVHIDYKKGEGFCNYDCHKCAEVCPSGAIKRIPFEEKQNTRIAMASINQSTCVNCGHCVFSCPRHAITKENHLVKIDGSQCIGCGKCVKSCHHNAIEIYGIKEQTIIN